MALVNLDIRMYFYNDSVETPKQVAHGGGGCPISDSIHV